MKATKHYRILNIKEIFQQKQGITYHGEIGVFDSGASESFSLSDGVPVYVNAFSYMLVVRGKAEFHIDEQVFPLHEKMLCLMSPLHLTHFMQISDDFRCLFLCIHKDFIDRMGVVNMKSRITKGMNMHRIPTVCLSSEDTEILESCIWDVRTQINKVNHLYRLGLIQNGLARFYMELDNILDRVAPKLFTQESMPRYRTILQDFISLLMNHFKEEHQVVFYARTMNMSTQYLTSIVKSLTGKTVNAFICELIYSEARNMLSSTDFSIQQIASILHFADQASFSKFFKRHSGSSPQEFRVVSAKVFEQKSC